MENEIENIKVIMQPFFDKQEEIKNAKEAPKLEIENEIKSINEDTDDKIKKLLDKKQELTNSATLSKNHLILRLNKLKENKEKEIAEYLQNVTLNKDDFYDGYKAMIRKDLEQVYTAEEKKLEEEIKSIDENLAIDLEKLNVQQETLLNQKHKKIDELNSRFNLSIPSSNNFDNEMYDLKGIIRKQLIASQKEIQTKLSNEQRSLDEINIKIKYLYSQPVVNRNDWKTLYDQSNVITTRIHELQSALRFIDESLEQTSFKESARTMTSWEQEEYDSPNKAIELQETGLTTVEPQSDEINEEPQIETQMVDKDTEDEKVQKEVAASVQKAMAEIQANKQKTIEIEEEQEDSDDFDLFRPILPFEEEDVEESVLDESIISPVVNNGNTVELNNTRDLVKMIFSDIMDGMETHFVKLNSSKSSQDQSKRHLSAKNGEATYYQLVGEVDLGEDSLKLPNGQYANSDDMKEAVDKYVEQSKGKTYIVKEIDSKVKIDESTVKKIKKCLKKCSTIHLIRHKKIGYLDIKRVFGKEKADDLTHEARSREIGITAIHTDVPDGKYINREDFVTNLSILIESKTPRWIDRIRNYFKNNDVEEFRDFEETQMVKTK